MGSTEAFQHGPGGVWDSPNHHKKAIFIDTSWSARVLLFSCLSGVVFEGEGGFLHRGQDMQKRSAGLEEGTIMQDLSY